MVQQQARLEGLILAFTQAQEKKMTGIFLHTLATGGIKNG